MKKKMNRLVERQNCFGGRVKQLHISETPEVSVVVPHFNNEKRLNTVLHALMRQTIAARDIIVVDNGSSTDPSCLVHEFPMVQFVSEHEKINSPYSARNRGIERSVGGIIALLDSTNVPSTDWLENLLVCFRESGSDLVAGAVVFELDEQSTVFELYDAICNVRMRQSVERGFAKTGNLAFKREVVHDVGLFPESRRSGGDVFWTRNAVRRGKSLSYCSTAVVRYPPKKWKALIRKQVRVAAGRATTMSADHKVYAGLYDIVRLFIPMGPQKILDLVRTSDQQLPRVPLFQLCAVGTILRVVDATTILFKLSILAFVKKRTYSD